MKPIFQPEDGVFSLLEDFIQSLQHLFENLREQRIAPNIPLNIFELRAPFPLQEIVSNSAVMAWLHGESGEGVIPIIEAPFVTQSFDHPVNRYIRWLVEQVIFRLSEEVENVQKDSKQCEELSQLLEKGIEKLETIVWSSPLQELSSSPLEDVAFLVILNDPLYASVHHYGRLLSQQDL